jgi:hypothetical protein
MDDHAVVFRTRGDETASLPPTEFIGRFLQHILPKGFVKIRHFGLMSSGNVNGKLEPQGTSGPAPAPTHPARCARALVRPRPLARPRHRPFQRSQR